MIKETIDLSGVKTEAGKELVLTFFEDGYSPIYNYALEMVKKIETEMSGTIS